MEYCVYVEKNNIETIRKIYGKIKDKVEYKNDDSEIKRINSCLLDLDMALSEKNFLLNEVYSIVSTKKTIKEILNKLKKEKYLGKEVKDILLPLTEIYQSDDYLDCSYHDINRKSESYYKYPDEIFIEKNTIDYILNNKIHLPDRDINLFQPNCNSGVDFTSIKNSNKNIKIYGITETDGNFREAKEFADKMAKGTLIGSKISNNAFDILYIKPNFKEQLSISSIVVDRPEKEIVTATSKYIREGGIFLYIIPEFRLYSDLCYQISKYYNNINIVKMPEQDYFYGKRLLVIGTRKKENSFDAKTYSYLRNMTMKKDLKDLDEYKVPNIMKEIAIFRGSRLDAEELNDLIKDSNLINDYIKKQNSEQNIKNKRPLQNFNLGQIGLVLTSGCLDGIIDEGNGFYHLIKGRVTKTTCFNSEEKDDTRTVNTTISNRVEINILTPDGEFKTLA